MDFGSARNSAKTCFRRCPTFHFATPNKSFWNDFSKLRTAVYPSNMAPIGTKLCQNAFQTIPDISFFDTQTFLLMTFFQKQIGVIFFQFFDELAFSNCLFAFFLKIWNNKSGYRQIRRRNSLPVVRLFFLYEPWRRGKSNRLCFWSGFWAEHDFNLLPFFCDFFIASIFWRIMRFGGARILWASPAESSSKIIACSSFIFSLRALVKG